jgi:dimethylhistidine N-methyltransferase
MFDFPPPLTKAAQSSLDAAFREDVLVGLSSQPRAIPARWLYDRAGSELFEAITQLKEYYPTRTERGILAGLSSELLNLTGTGRVVVEYGSGSSLKTPLVLSAIFPSAYVPIDISGDFLAESVDFLARFFPSLPMHPVVADFMHPITLPDLAGAKSLGFFPGSTIGNLVAPTAVNLLRMMVDSLGPEAQLLIGIDRIKSPAILIPAYDDAEGVTAAFNRNLLHRINRELDGTIPVDAFRHRAIWNDMEARIEMHLEARQNVRFRIAGIEFRMRAGETIHTENSIKYGERDARLLLRAGGWTPLHEWTDPDGLYGMILAEATAPRIAP